MSQARQRPTQLYDVAVLGNCYPGLVAAALLAQRGLRVLHVAPTAPTYESGGFRLPARTELLPAPRSLPSVHGVLDELTLASQVHRLLAPVEAQVVLPRARLELGNTARLGGEVAAALARLGNSVEETTLAVAGAPLLPRSLGERLRRWRHGATNRTLFSAPLDLGGVGALGEALLALHRFVSGDTGTPGAFTFARSTAPLLAGFHRIPDGGLAALLVGHVRARRGDALVARVQELAVEKGRFAGLQIGGETWRARTLLAALPARDLIPLLPEGRLRERFATFSAPAKSAPLQVRNLVLDVRGIPPGLGQLAIAAGFEGASALIEVRPALTDEGSEDPALRTVTVSSWEGVDGLLEEILPFHRRHVRHESHSPGAAAHVFWETPRRLGFDGLPIATPLRGLLLAGPDLLPGLGLEGAFLAGKAVAAAAVETVAKAP